MEALHFRDNIKIHFAGGEVMNISTAVHVCGVVYSLYTAFPFVERMVYGKGRSPIMPLRDVMKRPEVEIPEWLTLRMRHVIQDSGLFTLMFGARSGQIKKEDIFRWYDKLVEFTLNHRQPVTCVECDCQKLFGSHIAWDLRKKMRYDLPNNRIINVFHLEDGQLGLDRLIEFSDYIAISVPELRIAGKKKDVYRLASYIKSRKPTIDIHLLGCTEQALLSACRFCTSSDSTSFTDVRRYGFFKNGRHSSEILTSKVIEMIGADKYAYVRRYNNEVNSSSAILRIEEEKQRQARVAGNQDYYSLPIILQ